MQKDKLDTLFEGFDNASITDRGKYEDVIYQQELEHLQQEKAKTKSLNETNKSNAQDREQRKEFAYKIFSFVSLYMFGVFFILFLSGSPSWFRMSDSVLITLLGTTTANVIGVLVIVAKYLFPKK